MEKMNNPTVQTQGKRPWQGTTLGVLGIIGLALMGLVLIFIIIMLVGGGAMISGLFQTGLVQNGNVTIPGIGGMFGGMLGMMGAFLLIPAAIIFVLGIFITIGYFKGQKWAIIISIIFSGLAILFAVFDFEIISIILNGLIIWLEIICLRHPFYNKKTA